MSQWYVRAMISAWAAQVNRPAHASRSSRGGAAAGSATKFVISSKLRREGQIVAASAVVSPMISHFRCFTRPAANAMLVGSTAGTTTSQ